MSDNLFEIRNPKKNNKWKNEMRIETEELIIRKFKLSDKQDLGEYMLQRVNERNSI